MKRLTKTPETRRLEIIQTALNLFSRNGYTNTSVEAIIGALGVAKGTFYYYFKSKEDVLTAIVEHQLDEIIKMAQQVADDPSLDALGKMRLLLSGSRISVENTEEVVEHLNLPANRELHEVTNVQTVLRLAPILARIIEQGNREKIFNAAHPLEISRFVLAGGQFLIDSGLFEFTEPEIATQKAVMQEIIEKMLEVERGTFNFMNEVLNGGNCE